MSIENQALIAGYTAFKERVKKSGAALAETSRNGQTLRNWCNDNGYKVEEMSAQEISDALYKGASDDSVITRLEWRIKPAKLKLMEENVRAIQKPAYKSENEFEEKVKQGETKDKSAKAEADAQRQINELIETVQFIGRDGRISFAKTNEVKQRIIDYVAQQKAAKASLVTVAATVAKFLRDSYEEDEKSKERV